MYECVCVYVHRISKASHCQFCSTLYYKCKCFIHIFPFSFKQLCMLWYNIHLVSLMQFTYGTEVKKNIQNHSDIIEHSL